MGVTDFIFKLNWFKPEKSAMLHVIVAIATAVKKFF